MKKNNFLHIGFVFIYLLFLVIASNAQSTNIEYPTPISANEIKGKIKARDIGDSRLTTHYYVFDGTQGDIFINIETNNLEGDIDIFIANNLKPLTKISLFAESTPTQTGRELYLRKSERMLLRIEGRTPNDDDATYLIKFTGSFQSVAANSVKKEPKTPEIKKEIEGEVKVNSVGTIIETKAEKPTPKEPVAKTAKGTGTTPKKSTVPQPVSTVKPKTSTTAKTEPKKEEKVSKPEVIVTDNLPKPNESESTEKNEAESTKAKPSKAKTTAKKPTTTKKTTTAKTTKTTEPKTVKTSEPQKTPAKTAAEKAEELAKALENVKLVVLFKDGSTVERPMNDVVRFGVDKGMLTIVHKDGSIGRYSILEIAKISVE